MTTAACGIDCRVCRLNVNGLCSTCGPGTSIEGAQKYDAQNRLLKAPCPILVCARVNHVAHCLNDCDAFPCENFKTGPYPFSQGFLQMQERRRKLPPPKYQSNPQTIQVPPEYWAELAQKDASEVCEASGATLSQQGGFVMPFLDSTLWVDVAKRSVWKRNGQRWDPVQQPLLSLLCLVYLRRATHFGLRNEMISVKDLKDAHFFQGPHQLDTAGVLRRFGQDPQGFRISAGRLGGTPIDGGDAGATLWPFPKIPLHYILWAADAEFGANLSVLFDRSIERHLSADAIWGLVNLVSERLSA